MPLTRPASGISVGTKAIHPRHADSTGPLCSWGRRPVSSARFFCNRSGLALRMTVYASSLKTSDEDFYVTDHYTDKMLEYLSEAEEGKPWFAFMPYTAPHWPLQLPDDWLDKYAGQYEMGYDELRQQRFRRAIDLGVLPDNSSLENFEPQAEPWADLSADEQRKYSRAQEIYAGMVEHLDMSIARVINYLKESGQLENTVIVFTSDHGASNGEFGVDTGRSATRRSRTDGTRAYGQQSGELRTNQFVYRPRPWVW